MKVIFNMNDEVTIYPNESGWSKMVELKQKRLDISLEKARGYVYEKKTEDGGYRDQLWCIIQDFHGLFVIGSPCFKNATIEL